MARFFGSPTGSTAKALPLPGVAGYGEAAQKALEICQKPELALAAVFAREIDAFIVHKLARNEYSRRRAGVKVHALKELAAATGRANPTQRASPPM